MSEFCPRAYFSDWHDLSLSHLLLLLFRYPFQRLALEILVYDVVALVYGVGSVAAKFFATKFVTFVYWLKVFPSQGNVFSGAIKKMCEEFSWLIEAISTLTKAEGWPKQVIKKMDVLGERLSFGIDFKGLDLAKLRITGLGRGYISRLVANGYDSPRALSEISIEELARIIPEDLAQRIAQRFRPNAADVVARPVKNDSPSMQKKSWSR